MTIATMNADRDVKSEARESLMGLVIGSIEVRDVEIDHVEDLTGAMVWRVRLVLDAPAAGSWDVEETQELKRQARRVTDEVAARHEASSEGVTSILITARDAPEEDVAPPDEPEPEERTDVRHDVEDLV